MANLNKENIRTLGKLCRIEIPDEEYELLFQDLKRVLDYVDLLQEVDVSDLAPYSHMEEQGIDSLREDEIGELLPREAFLANSPEQIGGMIRVPPVMKDV